MFIMSLLAQETKWDAGGGARKMFVYCSTERKNCQEVILRRLAVVNVGRGWGFWYFLLACMLWEVNLFSLQIPLQTLTTINADGRKIQLQIVEE